MASAILDADMVGYSRLMTADETGTLTTLEAMRRELIEPKTAGHHGRVVEMMGDGTLMEFRSGRSGSWLGRPHRRPAANPQFRVWWLASSEIVLLDR